MSAMDMLEKICKSIANRGNEILDDVSSKLEKMDDSQLKKLYRKKKTEGNSPLILERVEAEMRRRGL